MRRILLMGAASVALTAQDQPAGRGVNFYSLAKEQALGAQVAEELGKKSTPVSSADVQQFVKRVGQRVAAQSPGDPAMMFRFSVITEDQGENPTHEPIAIPGGYIFISVNLILAARDEDEFAGMLAHAVAHVAARHGTGIATRSEVAGMASVPLVYMSAAGA